MSTSFNRQTLFAAIESLYRIDEAERLETLAPAATLNEQERSKAVARAIRWINGIRATHKPLSSVTDLLGKFGLTSEEGIALMCLAEALLRIPDRATADALISDKLSHTDWHEAIDSEAPLAFNAAGWALAITGKVVSYKDSEKHSPGILLGKLMGKLGQPVIREALKASMGWMADQFVMGQTINAALERARPMAEKGVRFSFDMLGEGARTAADAARFFKDYTDAINAVGAFQKQHKFLRAPGVSIKLSALHPRYEMAQRQRVLSELVPRAVALCEQAAQFDIPVTIDVEECDRLFLALEVFDEVLTRANLGAWEGLGFAMQAYEKRAPAVVDYFIELARKHRRKLMVRLVKGAYWDTEIKRAQERGWSDFPVYTRKQMTDVSYIACARKILAASDWIKPVFGTHNALTVAHLLELTHDASRLEFQRLHGMGTELHQLMRDEGLACCVYAPVGDHDVLLGYLVRRLLENGANSSFVHQVYDQTITPETLTHDPLLEMQRFADAHHPQIRRPDELFAPERKNSTGIDLTDPHEIERLLEDIAGFDHKAYTAVPIIDGKKFGPADHIAPVINPADGETVGEVLSATPEHVQLAFDSASKHWRVWSQMPVDDRVECLEKLADLLEDNRAELIGLLVREAGKTLPDAVGEVREAVDFCRYYAARARHYFAVRTLPGPTGELNQLYHIGRGVFACISPWNFPLAIFLGQIAAALVSGNTVIAKPAPQTPLIAALTTSLIFEAGIPHGVFHLLPGGAETGAQIIGNPHVAGVAFTGSTATARAINITLANKTGPIVPLIAETGGQNALIVDSSALPEQVVDDVMQSSFRSAGQRCSALRVLCLPHATADKIIALISGALQEIALGDPALLSTDVGPVIDAQARARLQSHIALLEKEANFLARREHASTDTNGFFVAPQMWEIPNIGWLKSEVFGPILHVVRYAPEDLDQLVEQINATGYGLSGGIHSRIATTVQHVEQNFIVGNFYVNRAIVGSIPGSQPFGGMGLSGTGPKAGGPHYLSRFVQERVVSNNLTAAGGNASLLIAASRN